MVNGKLVLIQDNVLENNLIEDNIIEESVIEDTNDSTNSEFASEDKKNENSKVTPEIEDSPNKENDIESVKDIEVASIEDTGHNLLEDYNQENTSEIDTEALGEKRNEEIDNQERIGIS